MSTVAKDKAQNEIAAAATEISGDAAARALPSTASTVVDPDMEPVSYHLLKRLSEVE